MRTLLIGPGSALLALFEIERHFGCYPAEPVQVIVQDVYPSGVILTDLPFIDEKGKLQIPLIEPEDLIVFQRRHFNEALLACGNMAYAMPTPQTSVLNGVYKPIKPQQHFSKQIQKRVRSNC